MDNIDERGLSGTDRKSHGIETGQRRMYRTYGWSTPMERAVWRSAPKLVRPVA